MAPLTTLNSKVYFFPGGLEKMSWNIFLFVSVLLSQSFVLAHVRLTFPPARKYDWDFLDNVRTNYPCGVPEGRFFSDHLKFC